MDMNSLMDKTNEINFITLVKKVILYLIVIFLITSQILVYII